jgi:hypothetical protein
MATRISKHGLALWILAGLVLGGCDQAGQSRLTGLSGDPSFHQRVAWKAEDFFSDPKVIGLCRAIEAEDVAKMAEWIAAGADVNARGKDNMTPLLWAFPDDKLERFRLLLEHGADPNVPFAGNFGVPRGFVRGDSVTCLAAKTVFQGYFEAVMAFGGDPNLEDFMGDLVLHQIVHAPIPDAEAEERVRLAIARGANLDAFGKSARNAGMTAAVFLRPKIVLILLESGLDPSGYDEFERQRLVHYCLRGQAHIRDSHSEHATLYQELLTWLKDHGEDIDEARADLARWATYKGTPAMIKDLYDRDIQARKEREAAARRGNG